MRYQPLTERTTHLEVRGWSFRDPDRLLFSGYRPEAVAGQVQQVILSLDDLDDEDVLNFARTIIDLGQRIERVALRLLDREMQAELPLP